MHTTLCSLPMLTVRITKQPESVQGSIGQRVELEFEAEIIAPHKEKTMKIEYGNICSILPVYVPVHVRC